MADTRTELGQEEARIGSTLPADGSGHRRRRRPLFLVLAIVAGVLIYGLAFQETQVDLEEITSETRQESLTRILRALAHPELVTYDTDDNQVSADIAVPCGAPVASADRLTVTPECTAAGGTVTITGTGFAPRQEIDIEFVPDSEFVITLRIAQARADAEGSFSVEATVPERESDQPQQILAITEEPIGSWGDRVEVYTDANENGIEDDPILDDTGLRTVTIEGDADIPAVALDDPAGDPIQFISTGDAFEAVSGLANGETAIPIEEATRDTGIRVTAMMPTDDGYDLTVEGPPGGDLSGWRASLYDAVTGEEQSVIALSDTIRLSPRISDTARITWDKILETVFLALIATTAGLLAAIPLSFVAARNIMRDISITVTNLALTLIAIPLGVVAGVVVARAARTVVEPLTANAVGSLLGLAVSLAGAWWLIRAGVPPVEEEIPTRAERLRRGGLLLVAGALSLVALLFASRLLQQVGEAITPALGPLGFMGTFFSSIGEILDVALTVIAAVATAGVAANLAGKLGYAVRSRTRPPLLSTANLAFSALAGAIWAVLVAQAIDWFYQIGDTTWTVVIPAAVGAVAGLVVAWRGMDQGEVDIGLSLYYASRTVFNALRSIEPLVMAIVFVVWVGLGPFAGSLALALHTMAALAKLYSEQVESILPGPTEAVRATGANRLQTIVYAVVPQIVPPYISFTMYRWDINVRMSTILGFVGGGGIGSILQQNINLVRYQEAAVQMLAIAIVVATMDYASSRLRERFV